MKHFMDFKPTEQEIKELDGIVLDENQKAYYERIKGTDTELFKIATLLAHRGQKKLALEYIDAIANPVYREDMRAILQNEMNLPDGAVW